MSIIVNVICALIGAIGAIVAMKIQRRDQQEDGMKNDLARRVSEIDAMMSRDIEAGAVSDGLWSKIRETEFQIEEYCRSRWFRPRANRRLLATWRDFRETLRMAKPQKPYRGYEFSTCSRPADFGLDAKIEALYRALH